MSKATRLSKLEAAFPDPDQAGRRCRDCGGVTIDDALNARYVFKHGTGYKRGQTVEWAEAVMVAIDAGSPTCERCGAKTLHGAIADLRHVPDDPE
jgi:hypothetical protein